MQLTFLIAYLDFDIITRQFGIYLVKYCYENTINLQDISDLTNGQQL